MKRYKREEAEGLVYVTDGIRLWRRAPSLYICYTAWADIQLHEAVAKIHFKVHQQLLLFRKENELAFWNDISGATLAGCGSFREYISRRQQQSEIWIWIWIHASSSQSRIYLQNSMQSRQIREKRIFVWNIARHFHFPSYKLAQLTVKLWYFNFGKQINIHDK